MQAESTSVWTERAERVTEEALVLIHHNEDAISTLSLAIACLRVECGELPAEELAGIDFPGEEPDESGCTCPPDLIARGGWTSRCPVHGL
jgi:hypothetical protein